MILKIKATNKNSGEVISYELEGDSDAGFFYEGEHMQEVADNKIREVNNNLILHGSSIYTIRSGATETLDSKSFDIEVTAE
jgi:hypothetical protein